MFVLAAAFVVWCAWYWAAPYSIPEARPEFTDRGAAVAQIQPLNSPKFVTSGEADQYLKDYGLGLSVEYNGQGRFYPFQFLVWHEVVNDIWGKDHLLVTYCPLCQSGAVFRAPTNDLNEPLILQAAAVLLDNNLVLETQDGARRWQQLTGTALTDNMSDLQVMPSTVWQWQDWRQANPNGLVMALPETTDRDYTRNPYQDFRKSILFPLSHKDLRLSLFTPVMALVLPNETRAYVPEAAAVEQVVNDLVDNRPIVLFFDDAGAIWRAYERVSLIDGATLTFKVEEGTLEDIETGSLWSAQGRALGGPRRGEQLVQLPLWFVNWFCLAARFPNLTLHLP